MLVALERFELSTTGFEPVPYADSGIGPWHRDDLRTSNDARSVCFTVPLRPDVVSSLPHLRQLV